MVHRPLAALALSAVLASPSLATTPLIDAPAALSPPVKLTIDVVKVPHVALFTGVAEIARPLGAEIERVTLVRCADVRTAPEALPARRS
jgi:hypothetical protein